MAKNENKKTVRRGKETQKETSRNVEFSFHAPEATEVYLAGDFNSWDTSSLPMKKDKDGVWKTMAKLLPGRYEYKLFVDNVWVENIPELEVVPNPLGTHNFVIRVR
jgi:1,4-alpha-glucan branching enzyme